MPLTCEMWIVQFGIEFCLKKSQKKLRSIDLLLLIIIKIRLTKLLILEHISQENLFGGCPNAWLWHVGNRAASNNFPPDVTQRSHDTKIERPEFSLRRLAPISDNFHILGLHPNVLVQSWLETYLYQHLGLFRHPKSILAVFKERLAFSLLAFWLAGCYHALKLSIFGNSHAPDDNW